MTEKIQKLEDTALDSVAGGKYTGPTFVYILQPNDNLYQLATRYGTTLSVVLELNNLSSLDQLRQGMRLLLPQK